MKWLFLLLLFVSGNVMAQCKTFTLDAKGDTLNCTDVKGNRQGKWVLRYEQVRLTPGYEEEGFYVDGKKEGTWRQFTLEGDLKAVEKYRLGLKDGLCQYFNIQAGLIREESWKVIDPSDPKDSLDVQDVFETDKFVKTAYIPEARTIRHGTWKYYDNYTGALVKVEQWHLNKLEDPNEKKKATLATTTDKAASDTTKPAPKVKPKEVMDFEKKNKGKKKITVRDGQTGG
jgi:hypothetical protein